MPRRLSNYLWIYGMKEEALKDIEDIEAWSTDAEASASNHDDVQSFDSDGSHCEEDMDGEEVDTEEPFYRYESVGIYGWSPATAASANQTCCPEYVSKSDREGGNGNKHQCFVFPEPPVGFQQLAHPGNMKTFASIQTKVCPESASQGDLKIVWSLTLGSDVSTSVVAYKHHARFCCRFKTLPREIRELVYEFATPDEYRSPILFSNETVLCYSEGKWEKTYVDSLIALLPPICHTSREILAEAGPVFLKNSTFIIDDEASWRLLEKILQSERSQLYISNAATHLRELRFQGLHPQDLQAREWEMYYNCECSRYDYCECCYCACPGWRYHPQSAIREFLIRCTGLRRITLGIREREFSEPSPLECVRLLRRVAHINDLSQLPNLETVTLICKKESPDRRPSDANSLKVLSLMMNWLIETTHSQRQPVSVEDSWYHTHDLQHIYDPGQESFREYDRVWPLDKRLERFNVRIRYRYFCRHERYDSNGRSHTILDDEQMTLQWEL